MQSTQDELRRQGKIKRDWEQEAQNDALVSVIEDAGPKLAEQQQQAAGRSAASRRGAPDRDRGIDGERGNARGGRNACSGHDARRGNDSGAARRPRRLAPSRRRQRLRRPWRPAPMGSERARYRRWPDGPGRRRQRRRAHPAREGSSLRAPDRPAAGGPARARARSLQGARLRLRSGADHDARGGSARGP